MKKFLFSFLLLGILSSGCIVKAQDIPDNTGTAIVEETETQDSSSTSSSSGDLASDIYSTADEISSANNGFLDALDGMFGDMSKADDGGIAEKTSAALSRVYGPVVQFARVFIIMALLALTVPDVIAMAIPFTVGFFESIHFGIKNNNSSGGGMGGGGSSSQRQGLLSPDYYKAVGGGSGSGGGEMASGSSQDKNIFASYISYRMKTMVFALLAIILLMTPVGFALLQLIVGLILKALAGGLASLGGLL